MDSQIFKVRLQRSKHLALKSLYIIGKLLKFKCLKWDHMTIWIFATQVMAKRKAESQTDNLIPDHKK
jgi:hypothetical protein